MKFKLVENLFSEKLVKSKMGQFTDLIQELEPNDVLYHATKNLGALASIISSRSLIAGNNIGVISTTKDYRAVVSGDRGTRYEKGGILMFSPDTYLKNFKDTYNANVERGKFRGFSDTLNNMSGIKIQGIAKVKVNGNDFYAAYIELKKSVIISKETYDLLLNIFKDQAFVESYGDYYWQYPSEVYGPAEECSLNISKFGRYGLPVVTDKNDKALNNRLIKFEKHLQTNSVLQEIFGDSFTVDIVEALMLGYNHDLSSNKNSKIGGITLPHENETLYLSPAETAYYKKVYVGMGNEVRKLAHKEFDEKEIIYDGPELKNLKFLKIILPDTCEAEFMEILTRLEAGENVDENTIKLNQKKKKYNAIMINLVKTMINSFNDSVDHSAGNINNIHDWVEFVAY